MTDGSIKLKLRDTGPLTGLPNRVFTGRSVSRGIGIGRVLCMYGKKRQFFKTNISAETVKTELERFRHSIRVAEKQLLEIIADGKPGSGQSGIFETHLLFLKDASLLSKIETVIKTQQSNCEWAVSQVIEEYSSKYRSLSDKHLREKYIDLEDVGERMIAALGGEQDSKLQFDHDAVIVASEIYPSTLIEIAANKPAALVTENGGWTSHSFILARELGIPAVTGVQKVLRRTETGETIIVDGFRGEIVLNPTGDKATSYSKRSKAAEDLPSDFAATPIVSTLDGVEIRICANLDLSRQPGELTEIETFGIGLYRSEFLFRRFSGYPSEESQYERYLEILNIAGDASVKIRTFDLGFEDIVDRQLVAEKNPALGKRGIRLSLADVDQYRAQIRALLRAGYKKNLGILIPMVSDLAEIDQVSAIIKEEKAGLEKRGIPTGEPELGAMIEVPAAAVIIDGIFDVVDFVSIGTNDLVQYLLAVDRDNDRVADNFSSLHPAVLRVLQYIFKAAGNRQKEVVVCGEMAGAPLYVPLLIGLGARTLSMNTSSMRRIANIISNISSNEAIEIADEILKLRTPAEMEIAVRELYLRKWPHVSQFAVFAEAKD